MGLDIGLKALIEISVVDENITHNVSKMWREAGIYESLYNSEGKTAKEVIPVLIEGYTKMLSDPKKFKELDSPNGWGAYENALPWLNKLILKFQEYPDGVIWVSK
jgi:hypothetical protein